MSKTIKDGRNEAAKHKDNRPRRVETRREKGGHKNIGQQVQEDALSWEELLDVFEPYEKEMPDE